MTARRTARAVAICAARALPVAALALVLLGVVLVGPRAGSSLAHADGPTSMGPLGATPQPAAPGGQVLVRGTHCVGTGGLPGVVTVWITGPDGSGSSTTVTSIDANGSWGASLKVPDAVGVATVTATCDIYGAGVPYPPLALALDAGASGGPPAPEPAEPPATPAPHPAPPPTAREDGTSTPSRAPAPGTGRDRVTGADVTAIVDDPFALIVGLDAGRLGLVGAGLIGLGALAAYAGRHRG